MNAFYPATGFYETRIYIIIYINNFKTNFPVATILRGLLSVLDGKCGIVGFRIKPYNEGGQNFVCFIF